MAVVGKIINLPNNNISEQFFLCTVHIYSSDLKYLNSSFFQQFQELSTDSSSYFGMTWNFPSMMLFAVISYA